MTMSTTSPSRRRLLSIAVLVALLSALSAAPASAQRYINVLFRSQVLVGSLDSIVWYSAGFNGPARVEYTNGDSTWKLIDTVTVAPGSGRMTWTIPDDTTSRAMIRFIFDDTVRARTPEFAIVYRLVKRIAIYQPNEYQPLVSGVPTAIAWSLMFADGFTGFIIADWSPDAGKTWTVIDSVPYRASIDSIVWRVPNDTTSHGQLRVRTSDGETFDTTEPRLRVRGEPFVRLLRPNGGEILRMDSLMMIVWESRSIDGHFTLEYSADGGGYWFSIEARHDAIEGADSVAWIVPSPPASTVLVRITHEEGELTDMSDAPFRIVDGTSAAPIESPLPTKLDLTNAVAPDVTGRGRRAVRASR